ncbi:hybrid sensor histidine kinase/response regulator [Leptospira sp. GIMC2001]|uniref:hybrid sensor histidine kinase/response regulator n=1 Tax=Leptospira sp. GIMC2001 TaxID=1513297 RepID=UPI002349C68A|nr:ATP-binding protein [Leptospira sp. GIMC2001]WCL49120.1 ATP-binding protein [Leptospira sp. GIMC2001]
MIKNINPSDFWNLSSFYQFIIFLLCKAIEHIKFTIRFLFTIVFLFAVSDCSPIQRELAIENGKLVMPENWKGEAVALSGTWLALPGIHSQEEFFKKLDSTFPISIPSTGSQFAGLENRRTVTIYTEIDFPKSEYVPELLGLATKKVWTAHKIFINNRMLFELGSVSNNPEFHITKIKPAIGIFPYSDKLRILIQISNFAFEEQGILEAPILGGSNNVSYIFYSNKFHDIVLLLFMAILVVINIGMYLSNTKDKGSILYTCLLGMVMINVPFSSSTDRIIWDIFPNLDYFTLVKIEIFSVYCIMPFYLLFLSYIFPKDLKRSFVYYYSLYKITILAISFSNKDIMFYMISYVILADVVLNLYTYFIMILAVIRKRPQAKLMLFGFGIVTACFVNDSLVELGLIESGHLALYGVTGMFFAHSSALVFRLRKIHFENELLTETLQRNTENLEIRVDERTRALQDAMEQVHNTNKLKDRFLSIVSHDIKSPLSGVIGLIKILINDTDIDANQQKSILDSSKKSLDNLLSMTSDILNFAKEQSIRILPDYESVNFSQLINLSSIKLQGLLIEKQLTMEIKGDSELSTITDPKLFGIVITNLISNAIKYCKVNGKINISFGIAENNYFLEVEDNGIGMDNSKTPMLFDYDKNHSTEGTSGEKGTGFGLPFSKEILDSLHATISVNTGLNKGSVFRITFPKSNKTILILDDDHNYRTLLREIFRKYWNDILIVEKNDGNSALQQIEKIEVDYILTDYQMPGMNGLDFSFRALNSEKVHHPKIAMITSYSSLEPGRFEEVELKAKEIGVDLVLSKSMDPMEIKKVLYDFMNLSSH